MTVVGAKLFVPLTFARAPALLAPGPLMVSGLKVVRVAGMEIGNCKLAWPEPPREALST